MPVYEYRCPDGHVTEQSFLMAEKPKTIECGWCGETAPWIPSRFQAWPEVCNRAAIDRPADIFHGTPLADSDGVNQHAYQSKKAFSLGDLGARKAS